MFHSVFERITYLEYQLKAKKDIIAAFESEERYVKMQEEYRCSLRHLESRIKSLEAELENVYRLNTKMRKNWMDVYEDLEREMKKTQKAFGRVIKKLAKKLLNAEQELDTAKDKIKEQQ
jgi:Mg2+ and Co2+ transporter CorA